MAGTVSGGEGKGDGSSCRRGKLWDSVADSIESLSDLVVVF